MNIVLHNPVIPQNTGNIGRLSAATKSNLHLIEPLGFELTDKYLKRAGLDYWNEITLLIHPSWEKFIQHIEPLESNLWFFSTHSKKEYYKAEFSNDDYLVFGSETTGLPKEFHQNYSDSFLNIPMDNSNVRSLNLSNAVSIVLYEARRQLAA